ncbi:MAG: hypothetical protein Q9182_002804 [Xanthomendoza sp. 2 TL-2023]
MAQEFYISYPYIIYGESDSERVKIPKNRLVVGAHPEENDLAEIQVDRPSVTVLECRKESQVLDQSSAFVENHDG